MKKYKVTIVRTEWSAKEFSVDANSVEEAKQTAIDEAVNTSANAVWKVRFKPSFDRENSEYEIEECEEESPE